MSEQQYIEAINANPDDRLPQFVYADWLDEMGDPRGEAWRVLIEAGKRPDCKTNRVTPPWTWWKPDINTVDFPERSQLDFDSHLSDWFYWHPTFHAAMNAAAIAWVRCRVDAEFEPDLLHRS